MPYPIENKLVVGVSTTALFDFSKEHEIYCNEGLEAFRNHQIENKDNPPLIGSAFPFIQGLLRLNEVFEQEKPIEVVILSRNHPDVSPRVMNAVKHHSLDITRCVFRGGEPPYPFMKAVNAVLYLSTDPQEVRETVSNQFPAGYVLPCNASNLETENQLRIAFDFDGVIANDEAEQVFAYARKPEDGLPLFHQHEVQHKTNPLGHVPLMPLLKSLSELQKLEKSKDGKEIRISIVTARNAPSHERMLNTLSANGIEQMNCFL